MFLSSNIQSHLWRLYITAYTIWTGFLLVKMFYFSGSATFNKLFEERYAKERLESSSMVDTGILSNNMTLPFHEFLMAFWSLIICNDTLPWSFLLTKPWLHYQTWPFTELREVFRLNIFNGCSMLTGDIHSSVHLVPSHLGLSYALLVGTNTLSKRVVNFPTFQFEYPKWLSWFDYVYGDIKYRYTLIFVRYVLAWSAWTRKFYLLLLHGKCTWL